MRSSQNIIMSLAIEGKILVIITPSLLADNCKRCADTDQRRERDQVRNHDQGIRDEEKDPRPDWGREKRDSLVKMTGEVSAFVKPACPQPRSLVNEAEKEENENNDLHLSFGLSM